MPSPGPFEPPVPMSPAISTRDDYRAKKAALKTALAEFDAAQKAYKAELDASAAELQDDPTVKMTVDHAVSTAPAAIAPAKLEGTAT